MRCGEHCSRNNCAGYRHYHRDFNAGKRSKIIKKKVRNYILMCRTKEGGGMGSPVFMLFQKNKGLKLNKNVKKKIKTFSTILFVLYLFLLIYLLFFAERFGIQSFEEREYHYNLVFLQEIKRFWTYREQLGVWPVVLNLLGNVVGFIPFGFILPIIHRDTRNFFFITFSGFALSLCVETIQLITKLGCFDVDDLIMNTLGAALGYVFFAVIYFTYKRTKRRNK